jgi:hypothetical protein
MASGPCPNPPDPRHHLNNGWHMTRITKFYPLARRFKVASERLVECDLRDPHGEFPDLRAEVRQELDAIDFDAQQAGYTLDDVSEYVVAEEERRANIESTRGLASPRD